MVQVTESKDVKVHSIIRDNEIADAMGFDERSNIFTLTERAKDGRTDAGFLRVRDAFDDLPDALPGLEAMANHSKAEDVREELVYPGQILMRPNGMMLTPSSTFKMTYSSLAAMMEKVTKQAAGKDGIPERYPAPFLSSLAKQDRAIVANQIFTKWRNSTNSKSAFKIGTRDDGIGGRTCFRVTSEGYINFPPHRIAKVMQSVLAGHPDKGLAKAQVDYDGNRSQADVLWFNPHGIEEAGCGDIFQFGVRVQSSEAADGKLKTSAILYNNSCLNYIIIDCKEKAMGEQKHFGRVNMADELRNMFQNALDQCEPMLKAWNEGTRERLDEKWGVDTPGEVFEKLNERGFGVVKDLDADENIKQLVEAAEFRGGPMTRAWAVDAITRRAHTVRWPGASQWVTDEQERQGGKLLTVSVLN